MTTSTPSAASREPIRFAFGKNWERFAATVNDATISTAVASLRNMLEIEGLDGRSFIDVGCGSGLFSLAARRLGAQVHSFDYDAQSVGTTLALRERYLAHDSAWRVEQGSILDRNYLQNLGRYDVVYSWGVLHHTGEMWSALANTVDLVKPGGRLFIAIYNDQGHPSRYWYHIKRLYNRTPALLRPLILVPCFIRLRGPMLVRDLLHGHPLRSWRSYGKERGMSPWYDVVDWVGGFPFEVAKPEQIFDFCRTRGFVLTRLKTCGSGRGCNEYVFTANRQV